MDDLMHKCREVSLLLSMRANGLLSSVSEKRILLRFSVIQTASVVEIIHKTIWNKSEPEKEE